MLIADGTLIALEFSSVCRIVRLEKFGPMSSGIGVSDGMGKVMRWISDILILVILVRLVVW